MKNLIAELLVKLAEKEEESKALVERVAALEIIAAALLRHMRKPEQLALMTDIESALGSVKPEQPLSELLREYMNELLQHPSN